MQTRHNCTACRLAKCFTVGMSSDLIRKEDYKKSKKSLSTTSKSNNTEQVNVCMNDFFIIINIFSCYLNS